MYMKWVEVCWLNLNLVHFVRGCDLWVIDSLDAVVGCLPVIWRRSPGQEQVSCLCRFCGVQFCGLHIWTLMWSARWQKLFLPNCSAIVTCMSSNAHCYRAVNVCLCWKTDHSTSDGVDFRNVKAAISNIRSGASTWMYAWVPILTKRVQLLEA